jgi:antitoxin VapB
VAEQGTVVRRPGNWDVFFEALKGAEVPDGFLSQEERRLGHDGRDRDPFEDWTHG